AGGTRKAAARTAAGDQGGEGFGLRAGGRSGAGAGPVPARGGAGEAAAAGRVDPWRGVEGRVEERAAASLPDDGRVRGGERGVPVLDQGGVPGADPGLPGGDPVPSGEC